MKIRQREHDEPVLNLTPMIDVVFQLLIFFMVATTFLDPEKELEIDLPAAESGVRTEAPEEVVINVFADGRIVVSGTEMTSEELLQRLRSAAQTDPQTSVTIRGDRSVEHQNIVSVLDACGRAGLINLSLGTLDGV